MIPESIRSVFAEVDSVSKRKENEKKKEKQERLERYRNLSIPLFNTLQEYSFYLPVEIYGKETEKIKITSMKPETYGKSILIHLFGSGKCLEYIVYRMSTNAEDSFDWVIVKGYKDVNSLLAELPNHLAEWVLT